MSEKEKNEKWFEHYSKYGIAFIAPQMQAIVKRAFFEGMVAVEHLRAADAALPPSAEAENEQLKARIKELEAKIASQHRVEQTAKPCIGCGSTLVGYCRSGCTAH